MDAVKLGTAAWAAVAVVAVGGLLEMRRRRLSLAPVVALAVVVTLTAAATYGALRFRVPVDVAALVVAALAVDGWWERRRRVPSAGATAGAGP